VPVRSIGEPGGTGSSGTGRQEELDLNAVVLPALLRQYGSVLATVLGTAIITWWLARRRYRR
jgi:hypothetical protein